MKNILRPLVLAKSVLITLGLTAAASLTDAAIHNKISHKDLELQH